LATSAWGLRLNKCNVYELQDYYETSYHTSESQMLTGLPGAS